MSSAPGWDARAYDESFRFVSDHAGDLVALLDPQPGERILDLGCGTGRLAAAIAECGAAVTGVDNDAAMIEAARAQFPASAHPTLEFARADGEALAEAALAGPFDAVFSNAALHWMTRPEAVLRGLRELLRPGGRLVAELGGHGNVVTVEGALRDALEAEGMARERQPRPWYFPSLAEYAALLEQHGFEPRLMTLFDRPTTLADGEDWHGRVAAHVRAPLARASCRPSAPTPSSRAPSRPSARSSGARTRPRAGAGSSTTGGCASSPCAGTRLQW